MLLTRSKQKYKYLEVAKYVKNLDRVVRLQQGSKDNRQPIVIEVTEVEEFRQRYGNFGLYTSVFNHDRTQVEEAVRYGSLYFDFDSEQDLTLAQRDVRKVYEYFSEFIEDDQMRLYFTGSKGFHLEIEPATLGVDPGRHLHDYFRFIAERLKDKYELKTIDFQVYDCLAGETLVMTKEGDVPIESLAGKTATLLTYDETNKRRERWVEAPVIELGEQPLKKITLKRRGVSKIIYATEGHRWYTRKRHTLKDNVHVYKFTERTTSELKAGDRLRSVWHRKNTANIKHTAAGIPHGITFADGTIDATGSARCALYGEKKMAFAKYFLDNFMGRYYDPVEHVIYSNLTRQWKSLPSIEESTAYIYGFLMGWFAADGDVTKDGVVRLPNVDKENLEKARILFRSVGINTYHISHSRTKASTIRGRPVSETDIYTLTIRASDLNQNFFLVPQHLKRWDRPKRRDTDWAVVSVEDTDRIERVYCAVVKGSENFALSDNLLTGNSRRMWRLPESIHQKTGLYKNELPKEALSSDVQRILNYCSQRRPYEPAMPSLSIEGTEWYKRMVATYEAIQEREEAKRAERRAELFAQHGSKLAKSRYGVAYIEREWNRVLKNLQETQKGDRNNTLYRSSFRMFMAIQRVGVSSEEIEERLLAVAIDIGLGTLESKATIKSALKGAKQAYKDDPMSGVL